ncbi:hypothetical protein D5F01_LYC12870 [Larimichthys crocea]|uniref:Uncharacterized protein n=1 Tax=Larimichthys crocea TaxID=215358 RepID=A0A6G0ICN3_LARCR|nr:hypothetical protein D5F01_LYC12870 [Larimichthys crocea]
MDTQAFLSPSSCPFRSSQEDEDFVVAETQSFILQTRDCQDNTPEDHSKPPNRAFGPESSGDENERTSVENESNLEATQDYGEVEEPARCSVTSEIEDQVDLALEATQAYISEPSDSEDKTDEDERKDTATQPLDFPVSSTLTMMETQPMSVFEEEECLDEENPFCSGLQVKARPQNEIQEREEPEEDEPQARTLSKALSIAETQPMHASDNEESDEEDLIPGPRRGKAQPLQPVDEADRALHKF